MATPSVILPSARHFLVVTAALLLTLGICACRRSAKNANANGGTSEGNNTDPEKSRREAQALVVHGKELYKNDQDEQAAKAFEEAIRLQPDLAEAHLRLGMAYAALERKPEADDSYRKSVELYKKLIQSNPKDAESFFDLGEAHSFLHQDEEATRNYRQATRLRPDDEEAFYQLGMSETRLAHYPEATAAFKKALELDPDDYRATDAIQTAQEGAQRIKQGKKHAEDMLKKEQENENANGNANNNENKKGNKNANSNSNRRPVPRRSPANPE
jgi:tetratricopeptide (TPR) repeat protein